MSGKSQDFSVDDLCFLLDSPDSSVNLLSETPEFFGQQREIECTADWTNGQPERFEGDSVQDCLDKACAIKRYRVSSESNAQHQATGWKREALETGSPAC